MIWNETFWSSGVTGARVAATMLCVVKVGGPYHEGREDVAVMISNQGAVR